MRKNRGGRQPASPSKLRRVTEDEVFSCWSALSAEQRHAATHFEDAVLIRLIREALQGLFEKRAMMQQLGIDLGDVSSSSPFPSTALFVDVFDLPWKVAKSELYPDVIMMDPDDQPPEMRLRERHLHGEDMEQLFVFFRRSLPDFMVPQTSRNPLPKARWKDLFASQPSSVVAMDQQLAKLMEQALWAMATDPLFAAPSQSTAEAAEVVLDDKEVHLEDWMVESDRPDSKQQKQQKKKNKSAPVHHSISGVTAKENEECPQEHKVEEVVEIAAPIPSPVAETASVHAPGMSEALAESPCSMIADEEMPTKASSRVTPPRQLHAPLASRARRISEDEVLSRWASLNAEQRDQATRFEDAVLIRRIRDASQSLAQSQALMEQMGFGLGGPSGSSLFSTSALLMQALYLPWKVATSEARPEVVMMDPDDQPSVMSIRTQHLELDDAVKLLHLCRCALTDFLGPRSSRTPLPKARWKDLFTSNPPSAAAMDKQLAKLMEQALWAMVMDPTCAAPSSASCDGAVSTEVQDVADEDWMMEPEKIDSKRKKKKRKKKPLLVNIANDEDAEGVDAANADEEEADVGESVSLVPVVETTEDVNDPNVNEDTSHDVESPAVGPIAEILEQDAEVGYPERVRSDLYLDADVVEEFKPESSESLWTHCPQQELGSEVLPTSDSEATENCSKPVLVHHYWGTGRRKPTILDRAMNMFAPFGSRTELTSKDSSKEASAEATTKTSQTIIEESEDIALGVKSSPSCAPAVSPRESADDAWKRSQLVRYIWNQTSQMDEDPSCRLQCVVDAKGAQSRETSAPPTPWSSRQRGFWSSPSEGASSAGTRVLERNTFLEFEEAPEFTHSAPRPRSLSPSYMKSDGFHSVAALSMDDPHNYWYR